jgi:LmbE family N-acetylglucosaminyl deacetylase
VSPRIVTEQLGLPPGSKVLVISRSPGVLPGQLAADGLAPTVFPPESPLPIAPASFAAAVVTDALEHTEWDRWLLQQVRRALAPDAPLVLEARNLWSLATPLEALSLAGRIGGLFARKAWTTIAPPPKDAPLRNRKFRGRRYRGRVLDAMLERLGFAIESFAGGGTGRTWSIRARAVDRGVLGGSVPLAGTTAADFELEQADFVRRRDEWLRQNPAHAPSRVETLEPAAFAGKTALVLAPHPDDEIVGCGGTILRLVRAGCRVVCVQATDGSDGWALRALPESERREVRLAEARAVAQAAGIREVDLWRADNRDFRTSDPMIARLAELLKRLEPALVFTPFLADQHKDHRTLNAVLAGAILASGDALAGARILGYEVWSLAPASLVCDVTEVRETQEDLLRRYEMGMRVDDFIDLCERRNHYHSLRLLGRPGYAEVFHAVPPAEYPALVALTYQRSPTASV